MPSQNNHPVAWHHIPLELRPQSHHFRSLKTCVGIINHTETSQNCGYHTDLMVYFSGSAIKIVSE
jgi:hypothetical protein